MIVPRFNMFCTGYKDGALVVYAPRTANDNEPTRVNGKLEALQKRVIRGLALKTTPMTKNVCRYLFMQSKT